MHNYCCFVSLNFAYISRYMYILVKDNNRFIALVFLEIDLAKILLNDQWNQLGSKGQLCRELYFVNTSCLD